MLGSIEFLPMVVACAIWGRHRMKQGVLAYRDNEAADQVVNLGYSSNPEMMQLLHLYYSLAWGDHL